MKTRRKSRKTRERQQAQSIQEIVQQYRREGRPIPSKQELVKRMKASDARVLKSARPSGPLGVFGIKTASS